MNVGDTVLLRALAGRDHRAEVVEVHDDGALTLRIGALKPLRVERSADPASPTPFTWRPA